MASEQTGNLLGVGTTPAALCRHAELRHDRLSSANAHLITLSVIVVNQPQI